MFQFENPAKTFELQLTRKLHNSKQQQIYKLVRNHPENCLRNRNAHLPPESFPRLPTHDGRCIRRCIQMHASTLFSRIPEILGPEGFLPVHLELSPIFLGTTRVPSKLGGKVSARDCIMLFSRIRCMWATHRSWDVSIETEEYVCVCVDV